MIKLRVMKRWRFWVGMLVSLVCLYLAFRGIDFSKVTTALGQVNYLFLFPALAVLVVSVVARAVRWRMLFYPRQGLRLIKFVDAVNIGYLVSNVFPARLGDFLRAYLIGDMEGVSKAVALSTVAVERVLDVLTVILFLTLLFPLIPVPAEVTRVGLIFGSIAVAAAIFLIVVSGYKEKGLGLLRRLTAPLPWLQREGLWRTLESLIDGFGVLRAGGLMFGVVIWSIVVWCASAAVVYLVMLAFGLGLPLSVAFFVLVVQALGVTVPSSPSYVGVYHYATMLALSLFAVDKDLALSYALVLHAFVFGLLAIFGLISLWRESLSYADLRIEAVESKT